MYERSRGRVPDRTSRNLHPALSTSLGASGYALASAFGSQRFAPRSSSKHVRAPRREQMRSATVPLARNPRRKYRPCSRGRRRSCFLQLADGTGCCFAPSTTTWCMEQGNKEKGMRWRGYDELVHREPSISIRVIDPIATCGKKRELDHNAKQSIRNRWLDS